MKLRIRGDSVRLRLGQSEVHSLMETGTVAESTQFAPDQHLVYELRTATVDTPQVDFVENRLRVTLPTAAAAAWAKGDEVSFTAAQPTGPGRTLSLLIEKDFKCLDAAPSEDQSDAFPNPSAACKP